MNTGNLASSFGIGMNVPVSPGRYSGVGSALKVLVDTLKEDRAIKAELSGQKELIDYKAKAEKENMTPMEKLIQEGQVADAIQKQSDAGVDVSLYKGVFGGATPQEAPVGLGTTQIAPVKAQTIDEDYEIVPSGDVKETVFGGQKIGYKAQPTQAKSLRDKLAEQKATQELKAEVPTIQQRNDLTSAQQQVANIKGMRTLAESIPSGVVGRVGSGTLAAISGGAMSTNKQLYDKQRPAFAVSLYRALTGDTRLSDADAKARALPLLWKVGEADAVRKKSFDYIEKALQSRVKLIQSGKYKQNKEGDFITPLEDVLAETQSGIDSFDTEEEAMASGVKGEVIIGGRRARID